MKANDSWMYIRAASIARKYKVASATMVRTKADTLSTLLLRYAHQAMTRNADRSGCPPRSAKRSWEFGANSWHENNDPPYVVPIEFKIALRRRSVTVDVPHRLNASTGILGRSMYAGGLINHVTSDPANLANARTPKYTASSLFLNVIAYILRWGRISWSKVYGQTTHLNAMKVSEEEKKKMSKHT